MWFHLWASLAGDGVAFAIDVTGYLWYKIRGQHLGHKEMMHYMERDGAKMEKLRGKRVQKREALVMAL